MDVVCSKKDFFKNPQKLPLNELNFKFNSLVRISKNDVSPEEISGRDGIIKWQDRYQIKEEKKSALDKCWLSLGKRFVKFHPFYPQFTDKENDEFLKRNQDYLENINFLTSCTYHQFWCYIMCEPCTSIMIKSFLENSISPYATENMSKEFLELYNQIYSGICHIYERILNFNVSATEYMPASFVLPFLKKSKLLNVRTIFILSYLYNHGKPQFVKNIIDFYFCEEYRETHVKELEELLIDILQELEKLDKLNISSGNFNNHMGTGLHNTDAFDPFWLEHTSSYILDEIASLQEFLSVYKPAFDIALNLDLPQNLPQIYQTIFTRFYDILENRNGLGYEWSKCEMLIKRWLTIGRAEFVNLFHKFMDHLYDKLLDFKNVCPEQERYLEMYLELISGAFDSDLFIKDYNKVYPIKSQFQLLIDNVHNFDKMHSDYLLEILQNIIVEEPSELQNKSDLNTQNDKYPLYRNGEIPQADVNEELYESLYDTLSEYLSIQECTASSSETKALPELIQMALNQYVQIMKKWENNVDFSGLDAAGTFPNNVESVNVNKPNENEINNSIKSVREMLPNLEVDYIKMCLERMNYRPEQVISRILDNELPLELQTTHYSKPGPSKEIKPKLVPMISKKSENKDAMHLLDDKKEKQDIKDLVLKASYAYDLDDDYDDRNEMYAYESSDESKIYRHLKQADTPECTAITDPSSSSEDEEIEQANSQNGKPRDAFCEDPAVVRARREAQRNSRIFKGNYRNNNNNPAKDQKSTEDKVKQQRDKKNTHKATRANHNRKGGAQWKRNKGMFPS